MSRYTGPAWKISRRLGYSCLGTGEELAKRQTVPGQHGDARPKKKTEYGTQLTEKQKLRFTYGVSEKQFRRFFLIAKADKEKSTGLALFQLLESRLDNLVYRMGFAKTRRQARQLVNHGHVTVNGRKVNIPSYQVKPGMVITLKESSRGLEKIKANVEANSSRPAPKWLEYDANNMIAKVVAVPARDDIDLPIEERLIVELYSK